MNREHIIEAIIAHSGAEVPHGGRARERLARLSVETLSAMRVEVEAAAEYGRKVNTFALERSGDLTAILLESEKASIAWREAVDAWSESVKTTEALTRAKIQMAAQPVAKASAEAGTITGITKYVPRVHVDTPKLSNHWHFSGSTVLSQHLAAELIRQVVYRLAGDRPDERYVERVCFELQRPVSEYLSIHLLKMVSRIADYTIVHANLHQLVGHLNPEAVARAEDESRWLSKLSYYLDPKGVGEAVVREGLAKAAVCVRELAPSIVIAGPKSQAFGEFLKSTRDWYDLPDSRSGAPVRESVLVAFESVADAAELAQVSSKLSQEYPGVPVRGVSLFGTPECSRGVSDLPLWTMVATSGEPVEAPWDSAGGFKLDGGRMVFGADSARSFEMETGDFKQRVETLLEADRQLAD